ncbi:hypothetical protein [Pseudosulfitobacter koreensis]|uniref:Argininosuccinate lyase n=1 Tax=Pseudosulfitobacter koreensis TaxID=2968472 RepID=A0ABT1Z0A9_9RHOB|nr:hypothetical protein [Pseudosulfitobacter koreense]MCR8826572.1 hypothetical protein [Pseudosulfitobacter koreense]
MKYSNVAALTAALFTLPFMADAAGFDLVNKTGYTITEVYAGPSNESNWGENILTGQIRTGQELVVTLDTDGYGCMWDVMYVFSDGDTFEEFDVDICRINGDQFVID